MNGRLPVTLIGGFLGSGKTSLLHHLISEHRGGHLAIFVENPGLLNLDAKAMKGLCGAMRREHDAVVEIPSGDEDSQTEWLEHQLREFASSGRFERVLIEVSGLTNAGRWARQFQSTKIEGASSLVTLAQVVCVVDALDFHHAVAPANPDRAPDVLIDFQQAQIRNATLLVLNKCDLVDDAQRNLCTRRLRAINPGAAIIETDYGEVPPEMLHKPATAAELSFASDKSETADENEALLDLAVSLFRAYHAFHPARFWEWFNAEHQGLLRVKGLIWLASRNLLVGGVSRTRWQNGCGAAGVWWAALPREEWPSDQATLALMQETWREPYGDRRQELVLIGDAEQLAVAGEQLKACLLTDAELAQPPAQWSGFLDPFPAWDLEAGE